MTVIKPYKYIYTVGDVEFNTKEFKTNQNQNKSTQRKKKINLGCGCVVLSSVVVRNPDVVFGAELHGRSGPAAASRR